MSSLFSIFNIASTGLMAQQTALDVTSHNIANANTDGYSKQKAKLETTTPLGGNSINSGTMVGQMGTGVGVSEIQRLTDKFIAYQVRQETSIQGTNKASEKYLSQVENVFNEPSSTGVSSLISTFFSSWQTLSQNPSSSSARTTVAQNSSALADGLNNRYNQLQDIKTNVNTEIGADVYDTNKILNQINDLNKQITTIKASGSEPNDLLDKRDVLLNQLSTKLGINVTETKNDGYNITPDVSSGPTDTTLISSITGATEYRFSSVSSVTDTKTTDALGNKIYTVSYYKNGDSTSTPSTFNVAIDPLKEKEQVNELTENRVLWASADGTAIAKNGSALDTTTTYKFSDIQLLQSTSGEMSGYKTVQQNVDSYSDQLNQVAKVLALSVNSLESGVTDITSANTDSTPFFVNSDVASTKYQTDGTLTSADLVTVLSAETNITAGNISVNKGILNDVTKIKTRTNDDLYASESLNTQDGATDGARAKAVANLQDSLLNIVDVGSTVNSRLDLFPTTSSTGGNTLNGLKVTDSSSGMKISDYFSNMIDKIAVKVQTATTNVTNGTTLLNTYTNSLQSVASVSLDEEMTNMIQYQHAYQANAKVISTLTTLLDVVIGLVK